MSVATSFPTLAQIEGVLRKDLFKEALGLVSGGYGTATGGNTTTIVDTNTLKSTQYSSDQWVGGWARISKDGAGAGAAPQGEIRPITTYDPATGTITVNPAFSAAVASTDEYELWLNPNPQKLIDQVDKLLTEQIKIPCWTILSEVPDGDMEQSGTSDWASTNVTRTKATAQATVMAGKQCLKTVSTAAGGYANSNSIAVHAARPYHVSALVRCGDASTTAKLEVYDLTNSASIASKTMAQSYNGRLWFEFTTPASCQTLGVRLVVVENTSTIYWDEVCLYPIGGREIRLPWWAKSRENIQGIFKLNPSALDTNIWTPELRGDRTYDWDVRDSISTNGLKLVARNEVLNLPLYTYGTRNETAFADDHADKKYINSNLLTAGTNYKLFEMLGQSYTTGKFDRAWIESRFNYWKGEWTRFKAEMTNELHQIITAPSPYKYVDSEYRYGDF